MNIKEPGLVEAACRSSWEALVARGDALRHYDFVLSESPEIVEAHRRVVEATLQADFDPIAAEHIVSQGRRNYHKHLLDEAKVFRDKLAKFLKERYGR